MPAYMAGAICESGLSPDFYNIVGGCCGTTPPQYQGAIADVVGRVRPAHGHCVGDRAGLPARGPEPLNIGSDSLFVNVGERTNVTSARRRSKALSSSHEYDKVAEVARQQVENGAQVIDAQHGRCLYSTARRP